MSASQNALSQASGLTGAAAMDGGPAGNFNLMQDHESEIVYNPGSHHLGSGDN